MRKASKKKRIKVRVKEGSENLFREFGIADATEKNTKVQLAVAINEIIGKRKLKQADVAALIKCTQPDVSLLINYKLTAFSIERLLDFLLALDNDVEITIRPKGENATKPPKTSVRIAEAA